MDQGDPLVQKLSLLRHRQRYLTHFAKYFMELLFDVRRLPGTDPGRWIARSSRLWKKVWKMCKPPEKKGRRDGENRGNPRNFPVKNRQRFRMAL